MFRIFIGLGIDVHINELKPLWLLTRIDALLMIESYVCGDKRVKTCLRWIL